MKGVYVFLADGFEETEALAPLDILIRAGVPVKTVSLNKNNTVTGSHRITVQADICFEEFIRNADTGVTSGKDMMIFPGGMPGSSNLASNETLMSMMNVHYAEGGAVAAICAAPALVLAGRMENGVLSGKTMTCYAGMQQPIVEAGACHIHTGVVRDGRVITASGAGHAVAFGLEIVSYLCGKEESERISKSIML